MEKETETKINNNHVLQKIIAEIKSVRIIVSRRVNGEHSHSVSIFESIQS
ncbi:MAG: hypothetical protein LBC20_13505 [Planctomycetaceae bacterium]|jgi:hypothetical protein|nr:hypothetical protein [Planctomycetaceae bacterium]